MCSSSNHNVSDDEACMYYRRLRGYGKGPKLIYRTSNDRFILSGPWHDLGRMQLLPVVHHPKLAGNGLWTTILDQISTLLDGAHIKYTSIDLVRFSREQYEWAQDGYHVTGNPTLWIGVLADSTDGNAAFASAQDILRLLKDHDLDDIDVAFRESEARLLAGPALYAPADDYNALNHFIDSLSTSLSLPIAGLRTPDVQGTLGFYFKVGDDLFGVTARHVLFGDDAENNSYKSESSAAETRKVVLMGENAFNDLLQSIQYRIKSLKRGLEMLNTRVSTCAERARGGDKRATADHARYLQTLGEKQAATVELENFWATLKKDWSLIEDRVIGHVVWAPPISGSVLPGQYTRDVCVIKLHKERFMPNFQGNKVDLGTEIDVGKFCVLMESCSSGFEDSSVKFQYPMDRLFELKNILSIAQIKDTMHSTAEHPYLTIMRGHSTHTTIGCLNGYESRVRYRGHGLRGNIDSNEMLVCSYEQSGPGPFSRAGDSGAAIVGANGDFIAQVTGGFGLLDFSDVTYGTPMEWLWNNVIKAEFPDAILFFDTLTSINS